MLKVLVHIKRVKIFEHLSDLHLSDLHLSDLHLSDLHLSYGYDGEDFLTLNLETESWIASKQQAFITKTRWDDKAQIAFYENYYTTLPSVSLLQKTSSSSVTCHATGFYPNRAEMFWRKDGEEIHDGVLKGEIVPNNDGTFQMTVDIDLSSAPSEDWTKYECVFQLSGEKDLFTKLEKAKIRNNDDFIIHFICCFSCFIYF
uniref:Ig-like domain-containing protein n=1 Tax=Poecilia reticulata TaxID=8081 RepID=A0A3P9PNV5_POERE